MSSGAALRHVFLASLRRRMATALSLLAIALGVALGLAVHLIQGAALDEFGRGMRLVSGQADLQVLGPRAGFDEALYVRLAQHPDVAEASPVLEIEARLPGRDMTLRILGLDVFRAARVSPTLLPLVEDLPSQGDTRFAALREDALFLSSAARAALGDTLDVQAGLRIARLRVHGGLPGVGGGLWLAVMDIAAAQQLFGRIGQLSRVDVRLAAGVDPAHARVRLQALLPAGVSVVTPEAVASQSVELSRAYRVNLAMLAAIALLTGSFLVFSTQFLSVVRRRQELAFLRALGVERAALMRGLLAEGATIGTFGSVVGVGLAYALAAAALGLVGADLGAGYFSGLTPSIAFQPVATLLYVLLGVIAGMAGAAFPARAAARMAPARSLHAGGGDGMPGGTVRWRALLLILGMAGLASIAPPVSGVPVFGYVAIALLLGAAVLVLPGATRIATVALRRADGPLTMRLAQARLSAVPGQAVIAGAGVVASVALAVSMLVMVHSFRVSVDDWLAIMLPADLYVRASGAAGSGHFDAEAVARVAALPGVAQVEAVRFDTLRLSAGRFPMTLIARPLHAGARLPLVASDDWSNDGRPPAWLSEAAADLLGLTVGDEISLPLGGRAHAFVVAGIWRDYARQHGAVALELDTWRAMTGDQTVNDLALWLQPQARADSVAATLREHFGATLVEITTPGKLRQVTLAVFDRTFFVTWLMEAVAIVIGLFGIATTFAALSISRRKEFGMLRHLGMLPTQIGRVLGWEGALTALVGVAVGMCAGGAIALLLIHVINRQSFHWGMALHIPYSLLGGFVLLLVGLSVFAARWAGRRAMRVDAVLAVREDW
ncbi:MAG: FtsX-like permease family protein [Rhodocyclales bacterium]|nr:FtsX-like permease family protein [Rhodocyclales bacterium]